MTQILRQSTQVVVRVGPAVAVGDGFTPVTTLAVSSADEAEALRAAGAATLDISGATFAAITGADGWYDLTLSTTATNTVGTLDIVINDDSLILPIFARFQVIEEAAFDMLYAGSALGYIANQPVDVNTIKTQTVTCAGGVTVPAATLASTTNITAGTITTVTTTTTATNLTNAPTAGDFTATMKTSIGTAVAASAVASVTGNVGGNVTGTVGSVVGAVGSVTGAVGSVTGAVGSVTGNVGGNVTGSIGSLGAQAKLDVNAEADTAISDAALASQASVNTIDDFLDTEIAAIKAKTDSLTFTVANVLDANVQRINDVTITGDGQVGTEFGV